MPMGQDVLESEMTYWKFALVAAATFTGISVLSLITSLIVNSAPAETSKIVSSTSWVGETFIDGKANFIRIAPQVFSGPELFFHRPNELIFNQTLDGFIVNNSTISFAVINDVGERIQMFSGTYNIGSNYYSGTVHGVAGNGSFILYPAASVPDNTVLKAYSGTYEMADGVYRTVGFEDVAGLVQTRLYYSDGEDFVLLFPISASEFITGLGERVRFDRAKDGVSAMTIIGRSSERSVPKIKLYSETEVTFQSDDATIVGTLLTPKTPGPHPAVIIAHTSAGGERHAYWLFASQFVQDGIAVLSYDRHGHGKSTGGEPFNLDTDVLAEDMKAGFAYLQTHSDIDPQRIGLMGFSNGSWVAARAAEDIPDVAFISVSMASGVSQVDAELFRRESALRAADVSEKSITQAVEALELYYKGSTSSFTKAEATEFSIMYQALAGNKEFQSVQGFNVLPTDTPLEQILNDGGSRAYMGFSPTETYLSTDAPVSFFAGELDENIPIGLTKLTLENVIVQRPGADITFVVYPNALHGMFTLPAPIKGISQDVLLPNLASYQFASGYMTQMRSWLKERTGLAEGE